MSDKNTILSRDELFDLVWSKPTTRICEEFQIPVTAVTKACAHLNIPRPAAGHWSAVHFGAPPRRPSLPPAARGQPLSTSFGDWCLRRRSRAPRATTNPKLETITTPAAEDTPAHPVAAKTRTAYRGGAIDRKYGLVLAKAGKPHLRLAIRPESLDRTIELLGRLLPKLEERGFRFGADAKTPDKITTEFAESTTQVEWYVQEIQERYESEPTQEEKLHPFMRDKWSYRSTGRLRVAITEFHPEGAAKSWGDGKNLKLDGKLDDIAEGFVVCAKGIQAHRLEMAAWRRRHEDERRQHEDAEARNELEKKRTEEFKQAAAQWVEARALREFRSACENSLRSKSPNPYLSPDEVAWLGWAETIADRLDPLRSGYLAQSFATGRLLGLSTDQWSSLRKTAKVLGVRVAEIGAWIAADLAQATDEVASNVVENLAIVAGHRAAFEHGNAFYYWMHTGTALLGGLAPHDLLTRGRIRSLAEFVADARTGQST